MQSKQIFYATLALVGIVGICGIGCRRDTAPKHRRAEVTERKRAMVVNGFHLPAAFVQLCEAIERGEAPSEWGLKENVDAYGRPWDVLDLRIYWDTKRVQSATDRLLNGFLREGKCGQLPEYAKQPGFIDDFTGVAKFVEFAHTTGGNPYAFDFGTDPRDPSVVYWYGYWRHVAPNFETFIALFVDVDEAPQSQWDDEDEEGVEIRGRNLLRNWVPLYVTGVPGASQPSFFPKLAQAWAEITPEERKEVEAEVREDLARYEAGGMKMTDEKRRRLEEVWERLRATEKP
jgi:SMI1 / KNR4 family (SUKH-1)